MTIVKRGPLENWGKKKKKLIAFASRANKPFAGKFAKDWKKSMKIVSLEKNLALLVQSLLWNLGELLDIHKNY